MQNIQNPLDIILNTLKLKGITEKQCLIDCDINTSFLTDWKNGRMKNPTYDKIVKISKYLDISLEYIFTGKEPEPKDLSQEQIEWLALIDKLDSDKRLEFKGELKGYIRAKSEGVCT